MRLTLSRETEDCQHSPTEILLLNCVRFCMSQNVPGAVSVRKQRHLEDTVAALSPARGLVPGATRAGVTA